MGNGFSSTPTEGQTPQIVSDFIQHMQNQENADQTIGQNFASFLQNRVQNSSMATDLTSLISGNSTNSTNHSVFHLCSELEKFDCTDLIQKVVERNVSGVTIFDLCKICNLFKIYNDDEVSQEVEDDNKHETILSWLVKNPKRGYSDDLFTKEYLEIIANDYILLKLLRFNLRNVEHILVNCKKLNVTLLDATKTVKSLEQKYVKSLEDDLRVTRFNILTDKNQYDLMFDYLPISQNLLTLMFEERENEIDYLISKGLIINKSFVNKLLDKERIDTILSIFSKENVLNSHNCSEILDIQYQKTILTELQLIDSPYAHILRDTLTDFAKKRQPFHCCICLSEDITSKVCLRCPEISQNPQKYCFYCSNRLKMICASCHKPLLFDKLTLTEE